MASGITKVSAIVSVNNAAEYLAHLLDALAGQTLREIEIICVDEGSVDRSGELIDEYVRKDCRIRGFFEGDQGRGHAWNRGMGEACGEYLVFLDSNDRVDRNFLEKAYARAISANADVVLPFNDGSADADVKLEAGNASLAAQLSDDMVFRADDISGSIFEACSSSARGKLFRREHIDKHGLRFLDGIGAQDDGFTYPAIMLADRIAAVDGVSAHWQETDGCVADSSTRWQLVYGSQVFLRKVLKDNGIFDKCEIDFDRHANESILRCYRRLSGYQRACMYKACHDGWLRDFGTEEFGAQAFACEESYEEATYILETSTFDAAMDGFSEQCSELSEIQQVLEDEEQLYDEEVAKLEKLDAKVKKAISRRSYRVAYAITHPLSGVGGHAQERSKVAGDAVDTPSAIVEKGIATKQDFVDLAFSILSPLRRFYSDGGARVHISDAASAGDAASIELEGFSRPLWALSPFWMGGGSSPEFEELYIRGLESGTDPESKEYWGVPTGYDQRFVEMGAIACALLMAPDKVWNPLSDKGKSNLVEWLSTIDENELPPCNWYFFRILVNLALDSIRVPDEEGKRRKNINHDIEAIKKWHDGGGWYTDGPADENPQMDYYDAWAFQYYGIIFSAFAKKADGNAAAFFRRRMREFASSFAYWFDDNGSALPYGRSLTYRFAQCAYFSACVFAGFEPLPLPVMKGIIVRNLAWWMHQPIFDRDGILTIGYRYPQPLVAESYSSPGSPYWAMKAFLLLALPEDHPFWSVRPQPLPPMDSLHLLKHPGLLVQRLSSGEVVAYAAGIHAQPADEQFAEKYAKFAYSTRFGFSVPRSYSSISQSSPDSMLAFVIDGRVFVRQYSDKYDVRRDCVTSIWHPCAEISVETRLVPCEDGHIRIHTVKSKIACRAYDCGFAVSKRGEGYRSRTGEGIALAKNRQQFCKVEGDGKPAVISAYPNTNLISPDAVIPSILYDVCEGENRFETKVTARSD